jgi:hypothetical protein
MASDGKTPMRIRDGQFVFIDEESCIGCTQVCRYIFARVCFITIIIICRTIPDRSTPDHIIASLLDFALVRPNCAIGVQDAG